MSFILDALRKSEHERGRHALPGLVDLPTVRSAPSRLPWIVGAIGLLLLVNVGILLYVLLRPATPAAAPPASAGTAVAASAAPPAVPPAGLPADPGAAVPPVLHHPEPARVRPLVAETSTAEPSLEEPDVPASAPAVRAAPALPPPAHHGVQSAGVPSINQLPAQATAGLPLLNIDLHVYSGDPAQRFVIINGQRLRDGGQLKEGPTVEQITPDGAVLDYKGTKFLLPRQ